MNGVWTINGQIGPHSRPGRDANGWLWEIEREGEARRVLVEVTGTAQAVAEHTLPNETRLALQTQGESEVQKILQSAEPPRVISCGTLGCSHLSAEEAAAQGN